MFGFFNKQRNTNQDDGVESRLNFSKKLQAVTNKIHATDNLDEIMLDLSKDICDLFNCDRLTLYALSKDRDFIFSKVKTGINSNNDIVLPVNSQSIAGYVALRKRSIRMRDVYDETELRDWAPELKFCPVVDQLTGYHTKQMLSAPLVNVNTKELLGVIQLLNNRMDGGFTEIDEEGLQELCKTMVIAFVQRIKAPLNARSKYEPLITDSIISAPELELAARWARRKNLDVEDVLVDEFQVKLSAIGQSLAKSFKTPYEEYKAHRVRPERHISKLNREFVEKNQWLPLVEDVFGLTVLTTDPEQVRSARDINEMFPYATLLYRVTTKREFKQTVDQFYGVEGSSA